MSVIRSRTARLLAGAGAALALALPLTAQAQAATTTLRLHAETATGESLRGPAVVGGSSVVLVPTNVTASNQKWRKTDVVPGFATYTLVSSIGTGLEKCLAASVGGVRPFAALCNPSSFQQQWTRGFVNDRRIENRATHQVLTRMSSGVVEMRFLSGGQVGQKWHEHVAS